MRASEFANSKLVIFDIDDTLVNTDTKVGVVRDGRTIKRLDSHDFTHYKLEPGEEFDFGAFRDAREFFANARPIAPMIRQLKQDIATGNRVIMVTARADFNDRDIFLSTFEKWGIDMSKVHVYRAGNIEMKVATEEKKKIILRHLLGKTHYDKVIMYDDAVPNLDAFLSLAQDYPWSKFYAWHVDRAGGATEYHRSGITETIRKIGANRWRLYSKDGSKNLGTFDSLAAAKKHEQEVQAFKHMKEQAVAEGTGSYPEVLYHGSTQKINGPLTPRQAHDIGGHPGSNKNAIYATDDPNFAIAYSLAERGSDTGTFGWEKEPRLIFFGGKIRHGKDVYIHVLPTRDEQGRPLFTRGAADAEWYSVPGVEAITPIKVITKPVDQYLHLLRKPTPEELKIFLAKKAKDKARKQGVSEGQFDSMVKADQAERNAYKKFVADRAGGDWSRGARLYAKLKNRPADDIFGDDARLQQFMRIKFDFGNFTKQDWRDFWLLSQHADKYPGFQKQALDAIEKHLGQDNDYYRYLSDRISCARTGQQKYGTQDGCEKQGVAEGGAETSWSDGNEKITLQDILELTKHIKQINLPINDNLKSKLLHWDGNPEEIERINQVTVSNQFPILVMVDEQGQINWILDGNHRLHKAIKSQAKTIPAKLIKPSDLSDKARKVFHITEQGVTEGVRAYHGNQGGIDTEQLHAPMWFTASRPDAEHYAGDDGYVVVVDLDITNPYRLRPGEEANTILRRWQELQAQGYDGIYDRRLGDWIPFTREQIRVISKDDVMKENFADGKVKEMAPPPISVKSATLYHGTPTLNNAQGIMRNGLKFDPELIAQKYQGSENFAPLPGVYLSKDFGNAVRYSFMSSVPDEQYAEYIKQEPYGYVFEFSGQSLSQTSPDEDELGQLLEKFVKAKNLPPKLSALIQGIPENLKSQLSQPDVSFETIAVAGKWLVSKLKPQTLQYLMQRYINVVNYGIMKPVAVWKIPKPEQRFLRDRQGTFDTLNGYINWANRYGKKQKLEENFADGKVKGKSRPGRVKRAGASCKGSVTDLRAKARKYGGERGKMYHWCANMKSGRKKTNEDLQDSMLSLDPWTFDQTDQGWRNLSQPRAIAVIKDYLGRYVRQGQFVNAPQGTKSLDPGTLYWHLGQLLAMSGAYDQAVSAMRSSLGTDTDWNDYVKATIAFLANNKKQFDQYVGRENSNKDTIDRLAASWGKSYKDAY